jgi:murein DD-endopeptidase MepM/ murein hydrolase activator NlpD
MAPVSPLRAHWFKRIPHHRLMLGAFALSFCAISTGALIGVRERVEPARLPNSTPAAVEPATRVVATEQVRPVAPVPLPPGPSAPGFEITSGTLERGESLARHLARRHVPAQIVQSIEKGLAGLLDFRRAQPGHSYELSRDAAGQLVEFRYFLSKSDGYLLRRTAHGMVASRDAVRLHARTARIAGRITSSLSQAVVELGESAQLANDFSEIFAWDVDFSRTARAGDEFRILYERLYRDDPELGEVYVRPGRILLAHYRGAAGDHSAFYFEAEEGRGGYYRPDGSNLGDEFLQAPVNYSRISSPFSAARRHPILRVTRPHHGIDYAAPAGTPVWSVAGGEVIFRGRLGGLGNLVKIRHDNGYVSHYAHLARFAKGLAVGQTVSRKDVIGYVGSTGLSTGPHLCFRMTKEGRYVDPDRVRIPTGPVIDADALPRFVAARDQRLAQLDSRRLARARRESRPHAQNGIGLVAPTPRG